MAPSGAATDKRRAPASAHDIKSVLGDIDEARMLAILALRPTIVDLEEASLWLAGDADVYGARAPLKGVASQIVTLLTAEEEEEPPPTR